MVHMQSNRGGMAIILVCAAPAMPRELKATYPQHMRVQFVQQENIVLSMQVLVPIVMQANTLIHRARVLDAPHALLAHSILHRVPQSVQSALQASSQLKQTT